jgi:hypothetical protein
MKLVLNGIVTSEDGKQVDWIRKRLQYDARANGDPSLNGACLLAMGELRTRAAAFRMAEDEHFVCPWHGRTSRLIPRGL